MASKRVLVSFRDNQHQSAGERLRREALDCGIFDDVRIFTENDLNPQFVGRFGSYLVPGSRGFGYYSWKPQVILQALEDSKDGDLVQWLDIGSVLNATQTIRLQKYFDEANDSPSGMLAFSAPEYPRWLLNPRKAGKEMFEYQWTKGDIFDACDSRDRKEITHTTQVATGAIFLRNCSKTRSFIERWLSLIWSDPTLVDDSPSRSDNFPGFIENRHDQSVFSVLAKLEGISRRPWSETDFITERTRSLPGLWDFYVGSAKKKAPIVHARKFS